MPMPAIKETPDRDHHAPKPVVVQAHAVLARPTEPHGPARAARQRDAASNTCIGADAVVVEPRPRLRRRADRRASLRSGIRAAVRCRAVAGTRRRCGTSCGPGRCRRYSPGAVGPSCGVGVGTATWSSSFRRTREAPTEEDAACRCHRRTELRIGRPPRAILRTRRGTLGTDQLPGRPDAEPLLMLRGRRLQLMTDGHTFVVSDAAGTRQTVPTPVSVSRSGGRSAEKGRKDVDRMREERSFRG